MAAINAEKQQNPEQQHPAPLRDQTLAVPLQIKRESRADIECGTGEKWNEESVPSKSVRRKFSRTVPYETEINGDPEDSDSVSVIVLLLSEEGQWIGNSNPRNERKKLNTVWCYPKSILCNMFY